ncbi:MAG: hypothetical protein AABX79_02715 [Nanoarchaeota archaeon]
MVQVKVMNEELFAKTIKEFNVAGETVRARQEEKQGLLNDFDGECKRFFYGKISRRALQASVIKANKELHRLDNDVRQNMGKARGAGNRALHIISVQTPVGFRATLSGIAGGQAGKPKKAHHKKKRR